MGGNALKTVQTGRISNAQFLQYGAELKSLLEVNFAPPGFEVRVIPSYTSKETHGDIDILFPQECLPISQGHFQQVLHQELGAQEVVFNSKIISFDYKGVQVDLIVEDTQCLDYAYNWYAYNDLGGLIGVIAKTFGLKHKPSGLWLPFTDEVDKTQVLGEVLVTTDYNYTLKVLGFDPAAFDQGFQNLEDIFKFVESSTFFHPDLYAWENRQGKDRRRDIKRNTYVKFLEWLETLKVEQAGKTQAEALSSGYFTCDSDWREAYKKTLLPRFIDACPGFIDRCNAELDRIEEDRLLRAKFGGGLVQSLTGLAGPELGEFIAGFKQSFSTLDYKGKFKAWVLDASPVEIEEAVLSHFKAQSELKKSQQ